MTLSSNLLVLSLQPIQLDLSRTHFKEAQTQQGQLEEDNWVLRRYLQKRGKRIGKLQIDMEEAQVSK